MQTTRVPIDVETHGDLKRLASDLHLSVDETVRYAVRRLNQAIIGEELRDVVSIVLGVPTGNEAVFPRPAIIVTAQEILDRSPTLVHIVPLTSTLRNVQAEITIHPGSSGLS